MDNPFRPTEKYPVSQMLVTVFFAFIGIAVLALIDDHVHDQLIVASFGSTAVLIYAAPKAPFSKPKNVLFGHLFSAMVAMMVVFLFSLFGADSGTRFIECGLAVALAILVMMLTGTIHPPAGATALAVALSGIADVTFLIFPLAVGLLFLMLVAYGANFLKEHISD